MTRRKIAVFAGASMGIAFLIYWYSRLTPAIPTNLEQADPTVLGLIRESVEEISKNPKDARSWERLGQVYEANELDSLARESYLDALGLDPENPKTWYRLARVRKRLGDRHAAMEAAERAVELAPNYGPLRLRIGNWCLEEGELSDANRWFRQACELDPTEPAGWWGRARVQLQLNRPDDAAKILHELRSAAPGLAYTHSLLAMAYRQLGRLDEAAVEATKGEGGVFRFSDPWGLELNRFKSGTMHQVEISEQLIEAERFDEALNLLEDLITREPNHFSVLNNLAVVYTETGRNQEAVDLFNRALSNYPDNAHLHSNIASTYIGEKEWDKALWHLDRVLALDPNVGNPQERRGLIYLETGRHLEAAIALEQALIADPGNAEIMVQLGVAQCDLRLWAAGLRKFEGALELAPKSVKAHMGVALAARNLGQWERAVEALQRAHALQPTPEIEALLARSAQAENAAD